MIRISPFRLTLIVLLLGSCSALPARGQELEQAVRHFDEGNVRYRHGDYRGSIDSYQRAIEAGFESGALYFNMGNAFYRLDAIGQSVRYYEKAAELLRDRPELSHNLEIVRSHTVDQFSRLPEPFWRPWWRALVRLVGASGLMGLGIVFYIAAAVVIGLRIRSGQTPWRRRLVTAATVFAIIFLAAGFTASAERQAATRAVVLIDEVTLLEAPAGVRSDLEIHEGLVVNVISQQDEWAEVRLPNGATGWLRSEAIGPI